VRTGAPHRSRWEIRRVRKKSARSNRDTGRRGNCGHRGSGGRSDTAGLSSDYKSLYGMTLYSFNDILMLSRGSLLRSRMIRHAPMCLFPLRRPPCRGATIRQRGDILKVPQRTASQDRTWLVLKSQYALENSRSTMPNALPVSAVRYFPKIPWQSLSLSWRC
jgi:hypothetical protein